MRDNAPSDSYDAIIVGGGHNGLVCAAYLAQAQMTVCVVEARSTVGGCAGSEQVVGATVNVCNCDHSLIRTTPIVEDLNLERHGLNYIELDPGQVGLGWGDGGPVPFFRDPELTLEALSYAAPNEVDNYRRYLADAVPVARLVLEAATDVPSRLGVARRSATNPVTAARLLAWSRRSVRDVLTHYFQSDAILGPAMAGGPAVWGLASTTPGTGLGALAPAFKHVAPVGRPVGGSGALTDALAAAVIEAGGAVLTNTKVTDIWCEGPRVRGVSVTADGDSHELSAPVVVVAANPSAAIVRYLNNPPPQASAFVDRWRRRQVGKGYEAKIDARITGLPRWRHPGYAILAEKMGWTDHLSPSTLVAPSLDEIDRAHGLMADGRVADRPMLFINVPSIGDPTLAPDGQHVLSIEVLFTPYDLAGGWEGSREPERWLAAASTLFETGLETLIEQWRAVTPVDYERHFSMPSGYADSFAGGPLAAVLAGEHPELTRYETPIDGLYLAGAATFPGAGVWGAPGRNASTVILRDRA